MIEQTKTVTENISAGTVTIALEKYQQLLSDAAVKPSIVKTIKTVEQAAHDKIVFGKVFMLAGGAAFVIGAFMNREGEAELRESKKTKK